MSYTHSWILNKTKKGGKVRQKMATFAQLAIDKSGVDICGGCGDGTAFIDDQLINFNGSINKEESSQNFRLVLDATEAGDNCITHGKPYDVVVKACLLYADELSIIKKWKFDGSFEGESYMDAVDLYTKVKKEMKLLLNSLV
jgi:hypothetical protein